MTKQEFIDRLTNELSQLDIGEQAGVIDYYNEMIDDGIENGKDETEMIESFGDPKQIADLLLSESGRLAENVNNPAAQDNLEINHSISTYDGRSCTAQEPVNHIVIEAKNSNIVTRIVPAGPVTVRFDQRDCDRIECTESDGTFFFRQNIRMNLFDLRSLFYGVRTVTVEIPEDYDGSLSIETSNAKIGCSDLTGLTKIRLKTSNAKTSAVNLACAEFEAKTSNAKLILEDVKACIGYAQTSNAKLEAVDCDFSDSIRLVTQNDGLRVSSLSCPHIELKTGNAKISGTVIGSLRDYAVTSRTSNAQSSLPTSLPGGDGRTIDVKTSNAPIDLKFESRD